MIERRSGEDRRRVPVMFSVSVGFWRGMVLLLVLALCLCAVSHAHAVEKEATFRWMDPTSRTDGQLLADGELLAVRLFRQETTGEILVAEVAPGVGVWSGVLDLEPGLYCFHARAVGTGGESDRSNVVCRTWDEGGGGVDPGEFAIPAPPQGLTLEIGPAPGATPAQSGG